LDDIDLEDQIWMFNWLRFNQGLWTFKAKNVLYIVSIHNIFYDRCQQVQMLNLGVSWIWIQEMENWICQKIMQRSNTRVKTERQKTRSSNTL
jgi:hypothetical protein